MRPRLRLFFSNALFSLSLLTRASLVSLTRLLLLLAYYQSLAAFFSLFFNTFSFYRYHSDLTVTLMLASLCLSLSLCLRLNKTTHVAIREVFLTYRARTCLACLNVDNGCSGYTW